MKKNNFYLGLSAVVYLSTAFRALQQIRHKANAQNLHRVFHFNPAAVYLLNNYQHNLQKYGKE